MVNFDPPYASNLTSGLQIVSADGISVSPLAPVFVVQTLGAGQSVGAGLLLNVNSAGTATIPANPATSAVVYKRVGVLNTALSGSGNFIKTGSGNLIVTGNNTNTGYFEVAGGTLTLGGIEVGGRYVLQNVLSDQSQLLFPSSGSQTVNFASNAINLQSFERVGSLSVSATVALARPSPRP